MRNRLPTRKARFLAALRLADTTMAAWAEANGVTQGWVSNLIAGRRRNEEIDRRIDEFVAKHLGTHTTAAA